MTPPILVSWISDFAIEWQRDLPEPLRALPRGHPMTWQSVLLKELVRVPEVQVHVVVLRKGISGDISYQQDGATFHVLKTRGGTRAPSLFWTDTLLIRKKLAQLRPQVVHAWGTERGAGLVASRMSYPYLVTIQGLLSWYEEVVPVTLFDRFAACWERVTLRRASRATTESTFAANFLRQHFPKLGVHQIEHASNWLFHQITRAPQIDPLRLIFVGEFCRRKGADLLLQALDQLKDELSFELVVLGFAPTDLQAQLGVSVSPKLWSRIQFRHGCTPAEVASELSKATLMVFPTRADTSPNAVKEAVVAGLPVVASRVGGIPDYIFPGQNGFLFASDNLKEMVQAIRDACKHPLLGKGQVAPDTLEQTRNYLSPKSMAEKFTTLYRELAAASRT